jgi:hypothetical protein
MALTYKIQEAMELQRETDALRADVCPRDIEFSRRCGIDPRDVRTFREYSANGFLIVIRCPKITARAWHGLIPPKPIWLKKPTEDSGVVSPTRGNLYVSDYDLMSIWRREGSAWNKVAVSAANGKDRGRYSFDGTTILKALNQRLVSRIQHGCQDDWISRANRGVKGSDHFAAFYTGMMEYFPMPGACRQFYQRQGLLWLYSDAGEYLLDVALRNAR